MGGDKTAIIFQDGSLKRGHQWGMGKGSNVSTVQFVQSIRGNHSQQYVHVILWDISHRMEGMILSQQYH